MSELTYENIKESIIQGDLKPNQSINEVDLASLLGVSRTPVREALQVLNKEGWVEKDDRGRLIVSPLSKDEVQNLFLLREYLEALSVNQAILNMDNQFIDRLEEINEKFKQVQEYSKEVVDYGKIFHSLILEQANNPILNRMLLEIEERIELYRRISVTVEGRFNIAVQEHQNILEAIKENKKREAEMAMRLHISNSYKNIVFNNEIFS